MHASIGLRTNCRTFISPSRIINTLKRSISLLFQPTTESHYTFDLIFLSGETSGPIEMSAVTFGLNLILQLRSRSLRVAYEPLQKGERGTK